MAVTCARKLSAVTLTTASFTLSLRRRYSCSSSLSGIDSQSVERRAQLLDRERAAHVVLEIGRRHRRVLHAEHLLVALLADERAVLLERRHREDALADFLVAHADAEPVGFGQRRALVHHLLQNLLLDAELLQQLLAHVRAVGVAIRLQLSLIRAPELAGGDFVAFDLGDGVAGRGVRAAPRRKSGM